MVNTFSCTLFDFVMFYMNYVSFASKISFLFDPVRIRIVSSETRSAVHMKDTHKATFETYIRSYPVGIEVFL